MPSFNTINLARNVINSLLSIRANYAKLRQNALLILNDIKRLEKNPKLLKDLQEGLKVIDDYDLNKIKTIAKAIEKDLCLRF